MSKAVSQRDKRTYFNNPLVVESLKHLPAALLYPLAPEFRAHVTKNLHHNSLSTREHAAEYISQRFAHDGKMNLRLAQALSIFGDLRTGREIFYFEFIQAMPVLYDAALLWLSELPPQGCERESLLKFLESRLPGKSTAKVATSLVNAFKKCGKLTSPKIAKYQPLWSEPPLDAFLYVLARLFPERSMERVDLFIGLPIFRAMLWRRPVLEDLLRSAERAGHISKISQLDQYHQFTLAGTGEERLDMLLGPLPKPTTAPIVQTAPALVSKMVEPVQAVVVDVSPPLPKPIAPEMQRVDVDIAKSAPAPAPQNAVAPVVVPPRDLFGEPLSQKSKKSIHAVFTVQEEAPEYGVKRKKKRKKLKKVTKISRAMPKAPPQPLPRAAASKHGKRRMS